jgi:hypothetical protein
MGELEKDGSMFIGNGQHMTMKTSYIVTMNDHLILMVGGGKQLELPVEIKADFEKIPPEWHHTMIQMMSVRYGGSVNCYSDTKPFTPKPTVKRKWWQFWKARS